MSADIIMSLNNFFKNYGTIDAVDSKVINRILRISFSLPFLFTSALTGTFIVLTFSLVSSMRSVEEVNQVISKARGALQHVIDSETGMRGYLLTNKDEFLEPYSDSRGALQLVVVDLKKLANAYPEQIQKLNKISVLYQDWESFAKKNIELKRGNSSKYIENISGFEGKRLVDKIRAQFLLFIDYQENLRNEKLKSTQQDIRSAIIVILILGALASGLLAYYSRKQLKTLSAFFDVSLFKQSELNHSLQKEAWLRAGLSQLNELSRGEGTLLDISARIISHLARYTGAQIGALYAVSEEDGVLRRISTFAYSSEAQSKFSEFRLNEGLVGQAAAENKLISVSALPDNYIQVNSSLGSVVPKVLIVAPASAEGSVKAVLELGYLNEPEPRVTELLELVSVGVALTVRSWQYRTRVQDLLNKSRALNDELQVQQGILKSTNALVDQRSNDVQKTSQYKTAFLANMSHEIRTPLGAMLGFANLLRDPNLSLKERTHFIDILSRNGESLNVIINDILDLSKVEAGQFVVEYVEVDPNQIVSEIISLLKEKANENGLILEYQPKVTTPKSFVSDPTRLRQILLNLVSNAIKFTKSGTVKITSYGSTNDLGHRSVCFEIADTGIGISEERREDIFEMFVQADETMARRFGGTGLGLSLARKLATAIGGEVSILSTTLGKGSTFLFKAKDMSAELITIQSPVVLGKKNEPRTNALDDVKVLIVDDSADNRELFSYYLSRYGAIVATAENGEVGYQKAMTEDFDVVIMDIQMSVMDGYTSTQNLRAAGYQKPIIALTAHAMSEIKQKCLDAGFTSYLTKPIDAYQLITTIEQLS